MTGPCGFIISPFHDQDYLDITSTLAQESFLAKEVGIMMLPRNKVHYRFSRQRKWIVLLMAFGILLFGCQTSRLGLEYQEPLVTDRPYEGAQHDMDYQLTYRYIYHPGHPTGAIDFTGNLTPRRGLYTFILRLHLLNSSGDVLATHLLYAPGTGNGAAKTSIKQRIEVPHDAAAIAFSDLALDPPRRF